VILPLWPVIQALGDGPGGGIVAIGLLIPCGLLALLPFIFVAIALEGIKKAQLRLAQFESEQFLSAERPPQK
jgi:hypothetical protein